MIHQPNCDKNTKGCAVYHEHGTPCIEIPCTCKGTSLPSLKAAGRAEFWKIKPETIEGYEDFLDTYADTIYQAAIDACLEALPEARIGNKLIPTETHEMALGFDNCLGQIHVRLSALKKSL